MTAVLPGTPQPPPVSPPAPPPPDRGRRFPVHPRKNPLRALLLAIGSVVLLGAVAWSGVSMAAFFFQRTDTSARTFSAPVHRVVIDIPSGAVRVAASNRAGVKARTRATYSFDRPKITETLVDGVLTLQVRGAHFGVLWNGIHADLELPRGVPVAIEASTGSGDMRVAGVDGQLTLHTGSGTIQVTGGSGDVVLDTGSGNAKVTGRSAASLVASSGSGSVRLELASVPNGVVARTGSGSATVVVPDTPTAYAVSAQTGSGGRHVEVRTDPASPHRINATTGSGSVTVRYP